MTYRRRMSPLEESIEYEPNSGCWLWTAALQPKGYAELQRNKKVILVHRLFYERYRGPIPPGLEIDHLCRVRSCVNPDHMEVVTSRVNSLRGNGVGGRNARKTLAKCGHPLSPPPRSISGPRYCRPCRREYWRVREQRRTRV